MVRHIPFNRPSLIGNEIKYIRDAVRLGQLAGDGTYTGKCQDVICTLTAARKSLITHSCTAALEMAAVLCDLGSGDEVIMPSFTFVSTANAVVLRGATPVFVDIDPLTLNMDPAEVAKHVTPQTRAIFAVHYAGFPADMDALAEISKAHDLMLVEDAAQALGATYKGRLAGSLGDMATLSFHETKNIISGEGGALTLNREDLFERAEIIREKGTNRSQFFRGQVDKYTWVDVGSSYLPGELIAAYLFAQLEAHSTILTRRQAIFDTYMEVFAPFEELGKITRTKTPPHCVGNGHMFYLQLPDLKARTRFIKEMGERDINTPFHYVPLHSAPAGLKFGRTTGPLPCTDHVADTLVRLPMYFDLGPDIEAVISAASDILQTL
ncbi:dTDP-4-amino-4,6-dideoxygalactose transaminase [uncultured Tateyamaria sp.]|uniref:dTDP-4-amino-4,6-dideoxygalactose transaminase n=1 Tax=uncultured Tateyamaria sp. TaxID=455651 RepID=UPI00262B47F2|nr:dTDP-4-amino-4,6-dideoxygalactose transaminase [uncultured Tateyamaria sp.]